MTVSEDLRHALSPALRARYSLGWEPDPLQERILTPMASDLVLNCTCSGVRLRGGAGEFPYAYVVQNVVVRSVWRLSSPRTRMSISVSVGRREVNASNGRLG